MAKIAKLIKYEGDNKTFIWKHPLEDFDSFTQLIVHESQEALFFLNGQALDLFGPGRYTLETQSIPEITKFLKLTTGKRNTPFHSEVYFINKTEQMAIKWGTNSKIQYMEPIYKFPLEIGACGEMSLRVNNARKLLLKIVGTERGLTQEGLVAIFKSFLMTKVKSYIASFIMNNNISIFEIDAHLSTMSNDIKSILNEDYDIYGVSLESFNINLIAKPDGEVQYERYKELHFRKFADIQEATIQQQIDIIKVQTQSQQIILESQAMAAKRAQEGYTYQQERGFDVADKVAVNDAVGQFTTMGVGLGTMAGVGMSLGANVGSAVSGSINNAMTNNASVNSTHKCVKCGASIPENSKFCLECGTKVVNEQTNKVVCPQCNSTVTKSKFCSECGYKFVTTCPKCGTEVTNGKFCPECGERIN